MYLQSYRRQRLSKQTIISAAQTIIDICISQSRPVSVRRRQKLQRWKHPFVCIVIISALLPYASSSCESSERGFALTAVLLRKEHLAGSFGRRRGGVGWRIRRGKTSAVGEGVPLTARGKSGGESPWESPILNLPLIVASVTNGRQMHSTCPVGRAPVSKTCRYSARAVALTSFLDLPLSMSGLSLPPPLPPLPFFAVPPLELPVTASEHPSVRACLINRRRFQLSPAQRTVVGDPDVKGRVALEDRAIAFHRAVEAPASRREESGPRILVQLISPRLFCRRASLARWEKLRHVR